MCGAVSGAVMALGLAFRRKNEGEKVDRSYSPVRAFLEAFEREFRSCNCAELIGCHLGTDEGQRTYEHHAYSCPCAYALLRIYCGHG